MTIGQGIIIKKDIKDRYGKPLAYRGDRATIRMISQTGIRAQLLNGKCVFLKRTSQQNAEYKLIDEVAR